MAGVLGLIPARGGSKGIPKKNIALLAGRPLLAYTCEAAIASKRITRVVLSTDDPEIAKAGRDCDVDVPFLRPEDLAQDDTPSFGVVEHCLQWLSENDGFEPDIVVLLQPTSPLRRAHHIDEALAHMEVVKAETVVSVISVPHRFSPYSVMRLEEGWLHDFWEQPLPFNRYRRQEVPRLYARNGPAILAARAEVISKHKSFYGSRVTAYVMGETESIDIDDAFDLEFAAWLIERQTELNQ